MRTLKKKKKKKCPEALFGLAVSLENALKLLVHSPRFFQGKMTKLILRCTEGGLVTEVF
jgi:hypothetical protein